MLYYDIAGLRFEISGNDKLKLKRFKPFVSTSNETSDIRINLIRVEKLTTPITIIPTGDEITIFPTLNENEVTFYIYLNKSKRVEYIIESNDMWNSIIIKFDKFSPRIDKALCTHLGSFIISNRIVLNDGIVIHASSICYSGNGIIFTAPSGTGKSTHTAMWEKHLHADILNDDSPVIRKLGAKYHVFGTPWSGSSDKSINANAPLTAIVILEKAKENSIKELSDEESVSMILPRVFLPYQNSKILGMAISHTEEIIKSVPKYLLKCKPEYAALELVHKCII